MAGRNHLYVPGPTNVPDSVLSAMHVPMEDHRAPDFPKLVKPLLEDLKKIFRTETGQAFIFQATGTAGWEVAMCNTLSPGDKVLSYRFGQFSHLWIQSARRMGLDVEYHEVPWGEGVPLDHLEQRLRQDANHEIKALLICHNETATGVTNDLKAIRDVLDRTGHPALFMIDGVSSIGSIEFRMDDWGIDVALTGSQKGMMLPAGNAYVCFSQKALEKRHEARLPRNFLNIEDQIQANKDGYFPYTPSTPMLHGLRKAIDLMLEEGLDNVYARHHRLAEGVRRAVLDGWGLELCARDPKWYSDTVSAIVVPEGFDARDVMKVAYYRYNLSLGGGLSEVAGKVFRIGHLGDVNELMLASAIVGAEMAMRDVGIDVKPGSGITAAMEYWRDTAPPLEA
ncbi:alanine-glyoxylate transaminase/serine-glyoxylate transaminase/serine-pyruvate transaminase [Methylomarinovum caldicuralii]|uniref:Alanine-glyoxylate transaminase/serine-glyoxylate transaminase/serine-pyruvate transaminase n=1 Tax=Methylomarinovum caldicuralii TaxID=438856 RepID=A0AAU9BQA8_9GAMM|nr:aminotransferase class V-fold PLP-dependent enzyme [Methylomarinovum caldicuralii]BCX80898.1 alanine-glyoxylate transaminase/serine-glyoxylate transaminase/serine-pyruvate transaminase [Methylomarinovum caldicuralii]